MPKERQKKSKAKISMSGTGFEPSTSLLQLAFFTKWASRSITMYHVGSVPYEEFLALTGITPDTFQYIFDRYCGKGTPIPKQKYLFFLFQYYKMYPIERGLRTIHNSSLKSARNFMWRLHRWEVSNNNNLCDIIDDML
jgi:hypothetical protein